MCCSSARFQGSTLQNFELECSGISVHRLGDPLLGVIGGTLEYSTPMVQSFPESGAW